MHTHARTHRAWIAVCARCFVYGVLAARRRGFAGAAAPYGHAPPQYTLLVNMHTIVIIVFIYIQKVSWNDIWEHI